MPQSLPLWRRQLSRFELELRAFTETSASTEEAAARIVTELYRRLVDETGSRACLLARLYQTIAYASLPPDLQEFARGCVPTGTLLPGTRCLTLLGSAGDEPDWNSRYTSVSHKAIPLASEEMIQQSPMIAQLLREFGVETRSLTGPASATKFDSSRKVYDVFHVLEAEGSPTIPAQEQFVRPHRVRSVVGFGGPLTSGDLFAAILFFRVPIPPGIAALFRSAALAVELELLRFALQPTFSSPGADGAQNSGSPGAG